MSWSDPSWQEAAREYHALRSPTRLSAAEFRRWRRESGFDDNTSSAEQQGAVPQTEEREHP
jgi:hypothetical protein